MNRKVLTMGLVTVMAVALMSSNPQDKVMVKENGFYVVNTTTLGKDVMGYEGPTPLKVYIKKNKVDHIEFLENQETPKYWKAAVKHFQEKWNGKTVDEAKTMEVDGRTGATFSSDAIKKNVKLALEYYEKNK